MYTAIAASRNKNIIQRAFAEALEGVKVESITLDNGSEFAMHQEIAAQHQTTVYFANPHSPWERGSNENMNGIFRFFFPKGTNFLDVSADELQHVTSLINNRPRKCLGWLSPVEFLDSPLLHLT